MQGPPWKLIRTSTNSVCLVLVNFPNKCISRWTGMRAKRHQEGVDGIVDVHHSQSQGMPTTAEAETEIEMDVADKPFPKFTAVSPTPSGHHYIIHLCTISLPPFDHAGFSQPFVKTCTSRKWESSVWVNVPAQQEINFIDTCNGLIGR